MLPWPCCMERTLCLKFPSFTSLSIESFLFLLHFGCKIISLTSSLSAWTLIMCCAVVQFPHNLFATKRAVVHFITCSKNKLIKGDHHVWHWPTFLFIILLRLVPLSTSCAWQLCAPTDCSLSTNVYKTHKLCSTLQLQNNLFNFQFISNFLIYNRYTISFLISILCSLGLLPNTKFKLRTVTSLLNDIVLSIAVVVWGDVYSL